MHFLDPDFRIQTKAGVEEDAVPGDGVNVLHSGLHVEEGLDESYEYLHGARMDGIEKFGSLFQTHQRMFFHWSGWERNLSYASISGVVINISEERKLGRKLPERDSNKLK